MACKCKDCKCKEMTNEQIIQQMDDNRKPYIEERLSDNIVVRHFDPQYEDHLFKWHWDEQDRFVEALNENDWSFQFDNELPQSLDVNKVIMVPKGLIHRVIKGTTPLRVKISFLEDNK